ncbi:MAG TPA: FAD-dependent oxidoreductase [Kribbellaceae bacterium]
MARVVVAGAGLGGLAAAVRLAKLGHEVTVCERTQRVGGALGSLEADGFRWDTGAAWTTLPAALRDLFRKSGRPLERVAELVPLTGPRRHVFADGVTLDLPVLGRAEQLHAWRRLAGERAARQWTALVDRYGDVWDVVRRTTLDRPPPRRLPLRAVRVLRPWESLRKVAERNLDDEHAQAALSYYATVYRSDPAQAPGFLGVASYLERTFGYWTFADGFGVLVDALETRLAERRVDVRLGTEAVAVETADGAVRGVRTADGEVLAADVVVSDLDPRILYDELVSDPAARDVRKRLRGTHDAQATYVVHLGLREPVPDLPFETVLHGDPPVVVRAAGAAPPGHRAWSVLVHGYPTADALDLLTGRGLDVRDQVVSRQTSPSWRTGVAWEGARTARRRAANISPVRGLYCVGTGAHPGDGVPGTALGAALVASAVGKA